jgi:LacI family transcriptional regulator
MKKGLSIKDISLEAGVSIATVSRVINKQANYSPEIEKKVLDVIERHKYVPNLAARALRSNHMPFIGIMMTEIMNQYFSEIVFKLQLRLFELGYVTVICNTSDQREFFNKYIDMFSTYSFSGLVYVATVFFEDTVIPADIPSVFVECIPQGLPADSRYIIIQADHVQAGHDATRYLLEQGCSKVLFLRSKQGLHRQSGKYIGYQHALWEHHISFDNDWLVSIDHSSAKSAYEKIGALLDAGVAFDGIYCNSDAAATGVLHLLKDRGIQVPGDVKVFGYTNSAISEHYDPPISSVDMNAEAIIGLATKSIASLIGGEAITQREYTLPAKLVLRETT